MNYDLIPKRFFAVLSILTLGFFGTGYYYSHGGQGFAQSFSSGKDLAALSLFLPFASASPSPSPSPTDTTAPSPSIIDNTPLPSPTSNIMTPPPPLPPISNQYAPYDLPPENTPAEKSLIPTSETASTTSSTTGSTADNPDSHTTNAAVEVSPFQRYLSIGSVGPDVKTLQILLNQNGFTVAKSGPGSKGKETRKYGPATAKAVGKLQCERGLACSGTPETTGYGAVDDDTRAILNALYELTQMKIKRSAAKR